jgi:hypothetical protein
MMLVATDSIVGAIAKLQDRDPQAARMLVQIGLFESLQDQIEAVRQPMTQQVVKNIATINTTARRRMQRYEVTKGEAPGEYAQALELVEKGFIGDLAGEFLAMFNRNHPRDDHGRFIRRNLAAGTDQNLPHDTKVASHITEALDYRDKLLASGLIGPKTKMTLKAHLAGTGGEESSTRREMKTRAEDLENALASVGAAHIPVELSVHRRDLNPMTPAQLAAVDLTSLTLQESYPNAAKLTHGVFERNGQVKEFGQQAASNWYGQTEGTNRQAYRRIHATGQALNAVAAPGSAMAFAGGVAQLAGKLGPEAETFLGPGIRRTAYRYRGTERRPDRVLWESVERATKYADLLADPRSHVQAKQLIAQANAEKNPSDYAAMIAAGYTSGAATEDQRDLRVRGAAAIGSLLGVGKGPGHEGRMHTRLPDLELAELSLESGEMPPSEGVIIDARGRVVTQAIGYNGDHYLPFDLRNLGALAGGQYVRTRATGGPTTEDVYTGLITGARQIQVVSNSGVFTLEFDPDLRGARRFNDKVARMVERYGSLLETIHTSRGKFFEHDLPEEQKQKINQQAAAASGGDQVKYDQNREKLLAQARFNSRNDKPTRAEVEEAAYRHAEAKVNQEAQGSKYGMSNQQRAREIEAKATEYIQNQDPGVRELKLNGEGYHRALRALKQEFPYYIREASFQSLPEWLAARNLPTMGYKRKSRREMGYVQRGQTNTAQAQVGGFRTARKVPTGTPERTTTPAPTAQPRGTEQPQGTGTPAASGLTSTERPNAPDMKSIITRKIAQPFTLLARTVSELVNPVEMYDPEKQTPEQVFNGAFPSESYMHRVVTHVTKDSSPGQEGQAMAKWFLDAGPKERAKFLQGAATVKNNPSLQPNNVDPARVEAAVKEIDGVQELVEPFAAVPQGAQKWGTDPSQGKPADYGEAPKWDAPAEEWDRAEAQMAIDHGDDFVSGALEPLKAMTPKKQREYVAELYEDFVNTRDAGNDLSTVKQDLDVAQRAWSFLHAKRIAARLHDLLGSDAGPKVPELDVNKAVSRPLYDPPAQDFLLDLRNQIDSLLVRRS